MTAPVIPAPQRNRLGIAALVLVIVAIVLPIIAFVIVSVGASIEGAEGDDLGYAILGGFIISAAVVAFVSPIAIAGVVLAVVALFRRGRRKVQAVLALVFGIVPALTVLGLPAAVDSFF
ncbi:MAG: hypothetical protein AB7K08_00685 [Microbacteriaceae bacterium]